eukprot:GFKZ01010860.1.p1 GENE.GFKZ01010860.1~~GFKZ01010860.1.p1  ORF type:complete len:720 (-),score=141.83 GFKZ01010860.1:849-3008(-)
MSIISKAWRRAEVFLEQVDESVAQASRRLVVEGATGGVDESEDLPSSDDENAPLRRAAAIPRAEERASMRSSDRLGDAVAVGTEKQDMFQEDMTQEDDDSNPWGVELEIDEQIATTSGEEVSGDVDGEETEENDGGQVNSGASREEQGVAKYAAEELPENFLDTEQGNSDGPESAFEEDEAASMSMILDPVEAMAAVPDVIPSSSQSSITVPRSAQKPPRVPPRPESNLGVEYDEYVRALKAESTELRKELELVEGDFEKSRRERSKLVKNLKRMKDIVSEMDESLRDKSAEARSLEADLVAAKDEISKLRAKSRENDARGKDGMDMLRKELNTQISELTQQLQVTSRDAVALKEENERLREALLQGHEVELATADGARQEASQAHRAYEAEAMAHRETRKKAKEREEALEAEAALATNALAVVQRKADDHAAAASNAKLAQRAAESKLITVTSARDAAFARIEDLQGALRLYEKADGNEAPGQKEAKEMRETVCQLETALEAKNVELNRLEGEVESLRVSLQSRKDTASPRTPNQANRGEAGSHQEVEAKLRHMADSALRKQAQLEVLRSENRALQHQLTTERKRTREAQAMAAAASSSRQSIRGGFRGILDVGEEDRGERAYGVRDGPLARFRTPRTWPRSVSRVITGVDRFSAQALAFLRKEPLLRIVILIYLVAMHVFVYSLLHWHVEAVSGSAESPHGRVASMVSGGQIGVKKT